MLIPNLTWKLKKLGCDSRRRNIKPSSRTHISHKKGSQFPGSMRVQVFLPASIAVSLLLVGVIKVRQGERENVDKLVMFGEVKLRVSNDVLQEYQAEKSGLNNEVEMAKRKHKTLEEEIKASRTESEKTKSQVDACEGEKVQRPWDMQRKPV